MNKKAFKLNQHSFHPSSLLFIPHPSSLRCCRVRWKMLELLRGMFEHPLGWRTLPFSLFPLYTCWRLKGLMRFLTSLLTATVLGLLILTTGFAGQGGSGGGSAKKPEQKAPTPPAQTVPEDGVPRITAIEAHDAFEKGKAIIVDVRSESSYRIGHIQGALWMPDVAARTKELPRDKMIITYCS